MRHQIEEPKMTEKTKTLSWGRQTVSLDGEFIKIVKMPFGRVNLEDGFITEDDRFIESLGIKIKTNWKSELHFRSTEVTKKQFFQIMKHIYDWQEKMKNSNIDFKAKWDHYCDNEMI